MAVIDADIATEESLQMLKANQYSYICVNRSKLKDYRAVSDKTVHLQDKRNQPIEIRWVEKTG